MDATTAGLVGAFGGAVVGLTGALVVDHAQGRRALATERRRAFAAFVGALYSAIGEFRGMPPNRHGGLFEKAGSLFRTDQAQWVEAQRGVANTSPQLFSRIDRLLAALALLQVLDLPLDVMAAIEKATDYAERLAADRTPELREEWWEIRDDLLSANAML